MEIVLSVCHGTAQQLNQQLGSGDNRRNTFNIQSFLKSQQFTTISANNGNIMICGLVRQDIFNNLIHKGSFSSCTKQLNILAGTSANQSLRNFLLVYTVDMVCNLTDFLGRPKILTQIDIFGIKIIMEITILKPVKIDIKAVSFNIPIYLGDLMHDGLDFDKLMYNFSVSNTPKNDIELFNLGGYSFFDGKLHDLQNALLASSTAVRPQHPPFSS